MSLNKVLWTPQPKQKLALSCPAQELFYGGAAGGGKSDFLVEDAQENANMYGKHSRGIIFRQSREQLGQLLRRADELYLPNGAQFRQKSKFGSNIYFFPNGAWIQFNYLDRENDVQIYQGSEFTYIGFDELGNYKSDYAWTYMQSRLRSSAGVKSYIRGTGNPGGPGQGWIKQRFMDGKLPNHIYVNESVDPMGKIRKTTSCFIPSSIYDNKILMENDPDYISRLSNLPPHLRDALLNGNWEVFKGQVFSIFNRQTHVKPNFLLDPNYWFKFCAMDWGWSRPFSLGWWAVNKHGRMYKYDEWYGCDPKEYNKGIKKGSDVLAEEAWEKAMREGVHHIVVDPACFNKTDDMPSVAENFMQAGWKVIPGNNDRKNGLIIFNQYLTNTDQNGVPMLTVSPQCKDFIRTIPALTPDPHDEEDVDTDLEDHDYDESRYAVMSDFCQHPTKYLINNDRSINQVARSWDPLAYEDHSINNNNDESEEWDSFDNY